MTKKNQNLPDFDNPPVIEVFFSIQFKQFGDDFLTVFGNYGEVIKKQFPKIELQPPLVPNEEKFELVKKPSVKIEISQEAKIPRCWFINKTDERLIQVQPDRFIFNWRKNENSKIYPRYDKVFSGFRANYKKFQKVLRENGFDKIIPQVCELTYINLIRREDVWQNHGELEKIFTIFKNKYSDDFLKTPEEIKTNIRFRLEDALGNPIGRLRIEIEPRFFIETEEPVFQMTLTARGFPIGRGLVGVERFFNFGRDQIVRGFTSITTEKMHEKWRRKDV